MTDLPAGYRWANEYETEVKWQKDKMILVPITAYSDGTPAEEGTADVALPKSVSVVVDWTVAKGVWTCNDEFDPHDEHDDTCMENYERLMDTDYSYDRDEYDAEYQNYMYGSSRYDFHVGD